MLINIVGKVDFDGLVVLANLPMGIPGVRRNLPYDGLNWVGIHGVAKDPHDPTDVADRK